MSSLAYRYGQLICKEAFVPALSAAFDTLKSLPAQYESNFAARNAGPDPRLFPALAYTQPAMAAASQGGAYATFDPGGSPGGGGHHRHRRHH